MLTQKQSRFGFEYCKDYNGTKAAIRAGYSENGAGEAGSRLLANVEVQKRIEEREAELATFSQIDPAWVLNQWLEIARADPRELTEMIVRPCPRCWPEGLDLDEPNPLCAIPMVVGNPEINLGGCGGAGSIIVRLKDTRKLSGSALRLFAGVKQTRNGIEIKFRDQDAALANIAGFLGMKLERKEVSGPGGGPIQTTSGLDLDSLSDDQLLELIRAKRLGEGTVEGTCIDVTPNSSPVSELEAGSNP